jgi:putative heme-binding domain-containing protein
MTTTVCWKLGLLAWPALAIVMAAVSAGAADPAPPPHPVVAWPSGPFEVRIAFDQPLDAAVAAAATGRLIPFEEEESVLLQAKANRKAKKGRAARVVTTLTHRGTLKIAAAQLADDNRTLVLVTDPQPRVATYSLHLSGIRSQGQPPPGESIDLMYGLGGVEASWFAGNAGARAGARPAWSGWWPDLDPGIVRQLTGGSLMHQRSLALLSRPGQLVLRTLVVPPKGKHTLRLVSNVAIAATIGGENGTAVNQPEGGQRVEFPVNFAGDPIELVVTLRTGVNQKPTTFKASYFREENAKDVRLAHARLLLPWASTNPPLPADPPLLPAGMAGGDPVKGEAVFFGAQAKCSACHTFGGKGGTVGPELGHQFERPSAEVYRDIADPGVWINPDYVAYTLALKDGRVLVGIVRAEGADSIRVTDTDARSTIVRRSEIEEFRPNSTSIMPVGLAGALGDGPLRDLLAFLTQPPATAASR